MSISAGALDSHNKKIRNLSIAWLVNSLAYSITYPFIPLYLHGERGLSMSMVGLIFPIMGVAVMLGPMISGAVVDVVGRRKVLIGGPLLRGFIFFILAVFALFDAPFYAFAIALFFSAATGTFFQNASDAYLTDITTMQERPKAYGVIRVGTNVGWMLGPMIGAFLARTPFSLLFALTGCLCIGGSFFIHSTIPESIKRSLSDKTAPKNEVSFYKILAGDFPFLLTMFFAFLLFLLTSQLYSTFSVYSTQIVGVSKNALGFIYAFNGLTIILLQIPSNRLARKFRLETCIVVGALLYTFGYLTLGFSASWWHLIISIVILTLGEVVVIPALFTQTSFFSPPGMTGRYMGAFGMVRGLGYSIGPYIGSLLFARFAYDSMMFWGLLTIFGGIASLGFWGMAVFKRKNI